MGRPRKKKAESSSREAQLRKRAASRGFTLERDGDVWYAEISGTRFGPMRNLDAVDEFLPKDS